MQCLLVEISLLLILLWIPKCSSTCNQGEYECYNGNCVPDKYRNDTINDCGDNSDEGELFTCPTRATPIFKCTLEGTRLSCLDQNWVNDNNIDCVESSDERKYIGARCGASGRPLYTPGCDDPDMGVGTGAFCNETSYQCECIIGWMTIERGSRCRKRQLDDPCVTDEDCYTSVSTAVCTGGTCACTDTYIAVGITTCRKRVVGDPCTSSAQCRAVVASSRCDSASNSCKCLSGLTPNNDFSACIIGESKTTVSTTPSVRTRKTTTRPTTTTTMRTTTFSNVTEEVNQTTTNAPPTDSDLDLYAIVLIALAAVFVAGAFCCCLFCFIVTIAICWSQKKIHDAPPERTASDLAKHLDYQNLEQLYPRTGVLTPLPFGPRASVHMVNEMPYPLNHLDCSPNESPNMSPQMSPGGTPRTPHATPLDSPLEGASPSQHTLTTPADLENALGDADVDTVPLIETEEGLANGLKPKNKVSPMKKGKKTKKGSKKSKKKKKK